MRRSTMTAVALAVPLALAGCSNLSQTDQRVLTGGAIGTGAGVVGTAVTGGCISCGAVVGGVVGAGAGLIYDKLKKER